MKSHYLAPQATALPFLKALPAGACGGWGCNPITLDPDVALVTVSWWHGSDQQADFEALPGVLPLGLPWEPLPPAAVAALETQRVANVASLTAQRPPLALAGAGVPPLRGLVTVPVRATDSVYVALCKAQPGVNPW